MKKLNDKKKIFIKPNIEVLNLEKYEIIATSGSEHNFYGEDYLTGSAYKF